MKKLITNIISIIRKITKPRDHLCLLKIIKLIMIVKEIIVMSHCNSWKIDLYQYRYINLKVYLEYYT